MSQRFETTTWPSISRDVDATSHDWPPQSSLHPSNLGLLRWWPSNKGGSISLQSGVTENWWISCGFFQCPIISTWCFIFIVHYDDFFLSLLVLILLGNIYIYSYIMICFVTYWTARFLSHFHAWNLEVPRVPLGASQPASLASNMGSGICRDFTRVPSRLRFTCQPFGWDENPKNIWWLSKKTQGKETKNGWKDSKMDKKAHASVKTSPSTSSNSTTSKLLQ